MVDEKAGTRAVDVTWANASFMKDRIHMQLLRAFAKLEMQREESLVIAPSPRGCAVAARLWHAAHWSRQFEWPWAIMHADLKPTDAALDAGGGDSLLQFMAARYCSKVVNLDASREDLRRASLHHPEVRNVLFAEGDLMDIKYEDATFDKAFCVSTLEHCADPKAVVRNVLRVLKPGGVLVLTFDVASRVRWNHTIDRDVAASILAEYGARCPDESPDDLEYEFDELMPQPGEPPTVVLKVICARIIKETVR